MRKELADNIRQCWIIVLGFSFGLAWVYSCLFGCGLVTTPSVHNGLERIWLVSGITEALTAVVCLAVCRHRPITTTATSVAAALFSVAGAIGIWLTYSTGETETFWSYYAVGGACAGVAVALLISLWGTVISSRRMDNIEFIVPASFFVSFAIYCILLLTKLSSVFNLGILAVLPIASIILAHIAIGKPATSSETTANSASRTTSSHSVNPAVSKDNRRAMTAFVVLVAVLWAQIAYCRVLTTPDQSGDRFFHFLIPFSTACIVALVLILICIRLARYINIALMYRWQLPLMLVSCALLYFDVDNADLRVISYSVGFLGMFGMQLSAWIGAGKYVRHANENAEAIFFGLALGRGLGIAIGCALSLFLLSVFPLAATSGLSVMLFAVVLAIVMFLGFNPHILLPAPGTPQFMAHDTSENETPDQTQDSLDTLFERQATRLAREHSLTIRETEVASLLLAGRSRPYIRDRLIISLNTVNTHVRSVFQKCDVHSQQELMDLVRIDEPK